MISNLHNEAMLKMLHPGLATHVRAALAELEGESLYCQIVSALRTPAEQNALYAQGRTTPGHIVTNAKAGQSMHNYALALDVVPFVTGAGGRLNWQPSTPQFQRMAAAMKAQGLTWGGDWKGSLGDFDHFQLGGLPASPSPAMQADYHEITAKAWSNSALVALTGIWVNVVRGKYSEVSA